MNTAATMNLSRMAKVPELNLDAIPENVRWLIATALRSAAEKWNEAAIDVAVLAVAESFHLQAAQALNLAEQFENC